MAIDFQKFKRWAEKKFGDIKIQKNEIRLNTIFEPDDDDYHLWCSPSGGKGKRQYGVFHCFKTDKKGSLVKLVQLVEKCDREDAISILNGTSTIFDLEKRLEEYFSQQDSLIEIENKLQIPDGSRLISSLTKDNWWRKQAEDYLKGRCIPINDLYVCTQTPYKFRILIPYYDHKGKLIYWNARHMNNDFKPKYRGPPKEVGVGKEDVIYMAGSWPEEKSLLYVCEGEFDAISLKLSELNGAAFGGKNLGEKQATILSKYKVVLCLDRDKAGIEATKRITEIYTKITTNTQLLYVTPPSGYKDWNQMLCNVGPAILHNYVLKSQKIFNFNSPFQTGIDFLT